MTWRRVSPTALESTRRPGGRALSLDLDKGWMALNFLVTGKMPLQGATSSQLLLGDRPLAGQARGISASLVHRLVERMRSIRRSTIERRSLALQDDPFLASFDFEPDEAVDLFDQALAFLEKADVAGSAILIDGLDSELLEDGDDDAQDEDDDISGFDADAVLDLAMTVALRQLIGGAPLSCPGDAWTRLQAWAKAHRLLSAAGELALTAEVAKLFSAAPELRPQLREAKSRGVLSPELARLLAISNVGAEAIRQARQRG